MILISHRGNIDGANTELENSPEYIGNAISNHQFNVEIDVWNKKETWFLGHDEPQYEVDFEFLLQDGLWLHAKSYETLRTLVSLPSYNLNFFYHTDEDYVLTSKQYIWAYPGKIGGKHTICVMPEWNNQSVTGYEGVCSDYIGKYK